MFRGIPNDYLEIYYQAFKESFHGISLSWLEVEICRRSMNPIALTDLYLQLSKTYTIVSEMPKSSFYRSIQNLIDNNFLAEDKKEGRSKIIRATEMGIMEFGRMGRYIFEFQMDQFRLELWRDILTNISGVIPNIFEKRIAILSPDYDDLKFASQKSFNMNDSEFDLSNVHFINFGSPLKEVIHNSNIVNAQIDDWMVRSDYFDIVLEFSAITAFKDQNPLTEALRVLKPGGHLVAIETTVMKSRIAFGMLIQFAELLNMSRQDSAWNLSSDLMTVDELKMRIEKHSELKTIKVIEDIATTTIISLKT
jgi:hypothetical protein